jgi:2-polyprenyl-3-methyl-5-hydroxy-6-metoxy-1,4-benzoquinol methylase
MNLKETAKLHEETPPDWYYQSLKVDVLQRIWHKKRFQEISALIEPVSGQVLDIGCADGMFSRVIFAKAKAEKLIGIDVLTKSIRWAQKHWNRLQGMVFRVGHAENLDFKDNSFDAVFALEVLEHVADPAKVMREIKRVLKRGGYTILLVPSDNLLFRAVWFLWLHFYPRGWVWRQTHIQTFRNNFLVKVCRQAGLTVEKDKKFALGMLHLVKARKF